MKTITVKRSKWARAGADKGQSRLLNDFGNMCCLGFACKQVSKISNERLLNVAGPATIFKKESFLTAIDPMFGIVENNSLSIDAMQINDNYFTTDEQKETMLTKLFLDNGFNLVFKD